MDFLLRAHRDEAAARRCLECAIDLHGVPEKITIDQSGANTAAIVGIQSDSVLPAQTGVRDTEGARSGLR